MTCRRSVAIATTPPTAPTATAPAVSDGDTRQCYIQTDLLATEEQATIA